MATQTNDKIYDESGLVIGEARPQTEPQDMYFCGGCNCFHAVSFDCENVNNFETPDILDDDVLPESGLYPEHDPHAYGVIEAENIFDRTDFILNYLAARDNNAQRIRDCWW